MASYPELRPTPENRLATAGRLGIFGLPFAARLAAVLGLIATILVVALQLAATGGDEGRSTPVFLTKALGARDASAPLVRKPAPHLRVAVGQHGFAVVRHARSIALRSVSGGGAWQHYAGGFARSTKTGRQAITVGRTATEEFQTVRAHQGVRTWRWQLRAPGLRPRIALNGAIGFVAAHRVVPDLSIPAVRILDVRGKVVTPHGAHWTLARTSGGWQLVLRLDDSHLPVPYVIDPTIAYRSSATANTGGTQTLTLNVPAGAATNDYLLAQVTVSGGTNVTITKPANWTLVRRTDQGTNVSQAIYSHVVGALDPSSYIWTVTPSTEATGGISAFSGVDVAAANPIDVENGQANTPASTTCTYPTLTTTLANDMLAAFCGADRATSFTAPATPTAMSENYDTSAVAHSGTPSPVYVSGFEHGATSTQGGLTAGTMGLFDQVNGTVTSDTTTVHGGSRSLKIVAAGAASNARVKLASAVTTLVGRVYVRIPASLPGSVVDLFSIPTAGGQSATIQYNPTGTKLQMLINGTTGAGPLVVADQWYRIDFKLSVAANPWTVAWSVDGITATNPTGLGIASTSISNVYLGTTGAQTVTAYYDDLFLSNASADYPIGDGYVTSVSPAAMGTSSTPASFNYSPPAGTAIGASTYTAVDDAPMTSIADYINQIATTAGSYVEMTMARTTQTNFNGVMGEVAFHATSTLGNSGATTFIRSDATADNVMGSPGAPTAMTVATTAAPTYRAAILSPPAGGWTKTEVNALKARVGWAADVSPQPLWDALLLEADSPGGTTSETSSVLQAATGTTGARSATAALAADTIGQLVALKLDVTAPDTSITSNPSSQTTSTSAAFNFTSTETAATFECNLDSAGWSACSTGQSYSSLAEGSHTFQVRSTDTAGNTDGSAASYTWLVDTTPASASFTFPASGSRYNTAGWNAGCTPASSICGTVTDGTGSGVQKVEVSVSRASDGKYWSAGSFSSASEVYGTATLSAGTFSYSFPASNFSGDGDYTVHIRGTDVLNQTETGPSLTFTYDTTAPSAPTAMGSSPSSPANNNSPKITGTAEASSTVKLFTTSDCSGAALTTGTAANFASPGLAVAVSDNTSTTYYATATDVAGNTSACTATGYQYVEDSAAPAAPSSMGSSPTSPANNNSPKITGMAEANSTVKLYTNSSCTGAATANGTAAAFASPGITVAVSDDTTTSFYATATDQAGNVSSCSSAYPYTEDSTAPVAPSSLGSTPSSPANNNSPKITGTAEANSTVKLYTNSSCTGAATANGTAAAFASPGITVAVSDDTTTSFYATATDQAGNVSSCSSAYPYTEDSTAPVAPSSLGSTPSSPANNNSPKITGTAEANSTVKLYTNSSCTGAAVTTGTAAAFASPGLAVAISDDTTTSYYASATDQAGNTSACSSGYGYTEDSTAPAAPSSLAPTPASPANNNSPKITGTAEAGSTVKVYTNASCTGAATATGTAAAFASPGITVAVSDDTTTSFYATATDAAGNVSACSSATSYVEDSTAPAQPTSLASNPASPANNNSPKITGTAEAGSTVKLYTNASCTGTATTTGTAAAFASPGLAVAVSDDTSTTYYATATDASGNTSACTSSGYTYVEDSTNPSAPSSLGSTPSSPANNNSPKITGTAEANSTVKLYTNSSCTGAAVTTGTAAAFASPGLAIAISDDTTTSYYASATDQSGNVSPCSSAYPYTEDSTAPAQPSGLGSSPSSPANNNSPKITGAAEANSTVKLYTNASCTGAATATGTAAAFASPGITVAVSDDTTTAFYATATDQAANTSACTSTGYSYVEDSTAPVQPSSLGSTPASPANNNSPKITGTAEANSTVKLYTNSSCTGAATATGTAAAFTSPGITVAVTDDTTTSFYATATDQAGNTSACTSSGTTYVEDSTAPAAPSSLGSSPSSPANNNAPKITGTAEAGSTVKLYTNASCTGAPVTTGTAAAFASPGLAVAISDDTATSYYATATDASGNTSACSSAYTYVEDSTAPVAPSSLGSSPVSPANNNSPKITGTAEAGSTVKLYTNSSCTGAATASGSAATFASPGISVAVSDDTTTSFYATATDAAGNTSSCSSATTYVEDSTAPAQPSSLGSTPASPANNNSPKITGTAEAGSTVKLYTNASCTGAATATGSAAAFASPGITVVVSDDTSTTYYATATDAAGNTSACTSSGYTYVEDSTAPVAPSSLGSSPSSPANNNSPKFTGTAEAGSTVKLYTNASCTGAASATGTAAAFASPGITVAVSDDTTTSFYATSTDAAGNTSACSSAYTYVEDSTAPVAPSSLGSSPVSPANNNSPKITGTAEAGSTVKLYTNSSCTGAATATGTAAAFASPGITVAVGDDTTTSFYATATDAAGNVSACSSATTYVEDSTAPAAPSSLSSTPGSPANNNSPKITGAAEAGSTVKLYTNSSCTGAATATGGAVAFASPGITVAVSDDTTTSFYATSTDAAGNTSSCSSAYTYVEDSTPPSVPSALGSIPASPANNNNPSVNGSSDVGSTVKLYTASDCSGTPVATGTALAFNSTGLAVAVGDDTSTTYYAAATDGVGNTSACSTGYTYVEDSTAPAAPSSFAFNPASPANNNSPKITGTAEAGSTVKLYTNSSCTGAATATGGAVAFASPGITVAVSDDTTTSFYATSTDAAGNTSACSSGTTYVEDSTAPAAPSALSSTPASPANNNSPKISGSAEAGSTVKLYTNSSCTGAATATGGAATFASPGITVAVSDDTTTSFYATSTDAAGNVSPCSSGTTYVEDSTAPAAPSSLAPTPASPANNNSPKISGAAETGSTVKLYTTNDCSGSVAASGTAAAFGSPGLTVSVSDDSSTSFYATATDAAGNTSACSSGTTYVEDSTAPAAPSALSSTPASPANNNSPKISGSAEAGSTVKLYTNSSCTGAATATGGAATFASPGITVAVSDDTTTSFYATSTDAAGNVSPCSSGTTYVEDSTAPAAPSSLAPTPASPANNNSPKISGAAETGSTVKLYTTNDCSGSVAASGTAAAFGSPGLTVSVSDDSSTSFYATATDAAGNTSACSSGTTYVEDSTAPAAPSALSSTPGSPANNNSPKISGTAEAGSTVKLYTNATCTGAPVATGGAASFGSPGLTVAISDDTSATYYATATDAAGNVSACSSGTTYVEDSTAPAAPSALSSTPGSPANNNSPKITGTAEAGSTVKLYTASDCSGSVAATGTAAAFGSPGLTVSVSDDSSTSFYATATDAAGNTSACSSGTTYVEDSTAPSAPSSLVSTPASPANNNAPTISGGAEAGSTVKLYTNSSCTGAPATSGSAAVFGAGGLAVSVADDTTTSFYATATDAAGNTSACSAGYTYVEDSIAPAAPSAMTSLPGSPANENAPQIVGSAELGSTVRLYTTNDCTGSPVHTGTAAAFNVPGFAVSVADNTTTTYYASATDAAGNVSSCSTGYTYVEDSNAPAAPSSLAPTPGSPANNNSPKISGTAEAGSTVKLYTNATCTGAPVATGGAASFGSPGLTVAISDDTSATYYATATDAAGNVSACSSGTTYVEDSTAPAAPSALSSTPGSPANNNSPKITGTAEAGSTVKLYTASDCSGSVAATGTAAAFGSPGLTVSVSDDSSTSFYATATDAAGNTSACSSGTTYVEDSTAPSAPSSLVSTPASPANNNAPTISGGAEAGSTVKLYTNSSCTGAPATSGSAAVFGAGGLAVSVADDTTTSFYATATDAAGNTSACSAGYTYVEDSTAPPAPSSLSVSPASPANDNSPTVAGNAAAGTTVKVYATTDCSGAPAASGTAANFASPGLTASVSDDSSTSFHATASDAAGNVSPCSTGVSYVEDSTAPAAPSSLGSTPGSPANANSPTIGGTAETGSTVKLYTNASCTGAPVVSGTASTFASPGLGVSVSDDSSTTYHATATDAAGNTSACSSGYTFVEDSTNPSASFSFPASAGQYTNASFDAGCATNGFCGSVSDSGSGVQKVEVSVQRVSDGKYWNGASFAATSEAYATATVAGSSWSLTFPSSRFPADGDYTVHVRATDNASNTEAGPSRTFTVDNSNPAAVFAFPAAAGNYRNASFDAGCTTSGFCGSVSDVTSGVQKVEVSVQRASDGKYWNGSAFSAGSETFANASLSGSSWSFAFAASNFPADGDYTVHVRATDDAGNREIGPSRTFTVDNVDPSAGFAFPASGGVYANAAFDGGCSAAGFCGSASDGRSGLQKVELSIRRLSDGKYWNGSSFAGGSETYANATLSGGSWSFAFPSSSFPGDGDYTVHVRATDNAGNTEAGPSRTFTVDNAPASTIFGFPTAGGTYTGASFDAGCATNGFCGSVSDATSSVQSVQVSIRRESDGKYWNGSAFSASGETFAGAALSGSSWSLTFQASSFPADGVYTVHARATDGAGNVETGPSRAFTIDTTDPSAAISFPASAGKYTAATFDSGCATSGFCGTAADATSGLQKVEVSVQRASDGKYWNGSAFSAGSETFANASLSGSSWSFAFAASNFPADGDYTVHVRATDDAGNREIGPSRTFTVDDSAPSAPSLSFGSFSSASQTGSTIFFRPGVSGGFVANATSTPGPSGLASVTFPNLGSSWTGGGTTSSSPYGTTYAFGATSTAPSGNQNVFATSGAGKSSANSVFTVVADGTAPTSSISCAGGCAGWHAISPVSVSLSATDGAGSGVATIMYTTDGTTPTLLNGTAYVAPFNVVSNAVVQYRAYDAVGNAEAVRSQSIDIDTTAPSAPGLTFGSFTNASYSAGSSTLYFRPGVAGGFTVDGSSSDGESGVSSLTFPSLGANWTGGGADTSSPFQGVYGFDASASAPSGNEDVTATNGAGISSAATSFTVAADSTAPTTSIACDTGSCAGWFANPPVSVTLSASDAGSGLARIRYTTDGTDPTSSATAQTYSGAISVSVTTTVKYAATDKVGNVETVGTQLVRVDATAPSVSLTAPTDGSFVNAADPSTYTLTASASDGGSGVASVEFFECATTNVNCAGSTWSSIAVDLVAPYTAPWIVPGNGNRALKAVATDVAGYATASSVNVYVDRTAPTATVSDPGANVSGTIVLTSNANDADSGVKHVQFQRCDSPCAGTWTNLGAADTTSPYSASVDTTGLADGLYDFRAVATDNAGNDSTPTPVTGRRIDNSNPSALFTFPAPGGNYSSAGFAAGCATAGFCGTQSDTGSGVGSVQVSIKRTSDGEYWNGTSFSATGETFLTASLAGGNWSYAFAPSNFPADGGYSVHVRATDNAGNTEVGATRSFTVDNTDPSAVFSFPAAGAAYNGSSWNAGCGTNGFCGTASDVDSGLQKVALSIQRVSDGSYWNGSSFAAGPENFVDAALSGSNWSYGFGSSSFPADGDYTVHVRATDNAGNVEAGPARTFTVDDTAPTGALTAPANGALLSGTISISANASDATAGVASVQLQVKPSGASGFSTVDTVTAAPYTTNWDSTLVADGPADLRALVTDNAGNTFATSTRTITVDNIAPIVDLGDPGAAVRGNVTFAATSSADTAKVDFYRSPAGANTWVRFASDTTAPFSVQLDTTLPATPDGLYDFRAVAIDQSANVGTSQTRSARIDNTVPSASLTSPAAGSTVGGPATSLTAAASDAGSGVDSVKFQYRPSGGGAYTDIATDSSAPYATSWDATALPSGGYDLRVVATDAAGNTFATAPAAVTVDSTPPSVTFNDPGTHVNGLVSLTATAASDTDHVVFERRPSAGGAWSPIATDSAAPWSASFDTNLVADGLYDLRAVAFDAVGNSDSDEHDSVSVDNTPPVLVSSTPADGSVLASAGSVALTANEPLGGVLSPTLDGTATAAPSISGATATFATGALASGPHTLAGRIEDLAGGTRFVLVHFTVWNGTASDYPYVEKNSFLANGAMLTSVDSAARVTLPANVLADPGTGDWLVLRVDPSPAPVAVGAGYTAASEIMGVTATWALAGGQVHAFAHPIEIAMTNTTAATVVPATLENGTWRIIRRVPIAGVLPSGWSDGYYSDNAGVHVLTMHLSEFALVRDVQPPTPPTHLAGTVGAKGLTLTWEDGADNSGTIARCNVYIDGKLFASLDEPKDTIDLGAFAPNDARIFTLSDTDASGNESAQTKPLRAIPDLRGMTVNEAKKALQERGFNVGSVRQVGSTGARPGTVIGSKGIVLAEEGAAIDLSVAESAAKAPLRFGAKVPARFSWVKSRALAVRFTSSRAASVSATLSSPAGKRLRTWRLSLKAGTSSARLPMPASARRSGRYSVRWLARSGSDTAKQVSRLRVIGRRAAAATSTQHAHAKVAKVSHGNPAPPPPAPAPAAVVPALTPPTVTAPAATPTQSSATQSPSATGLVVPVTPHAATPPATPPTGIVHARRQLTHPQRKHATTHRSRRHSVVGASPVSHDSSGGSGSGAMLAVLGGIAGVLLLGAFFLSLKAAPRAPRPRAVRG